MASSTDKGAGPLKTPIAAPLSTCTVPEITPLTAEQETKYSWLLQQIKEWKDVPSQKDKEHAGSLTDSERMWLTRECLLRYLRATKWHEKESEKRIRDTIAWRREFGVERLTFDHISPEQETGKQAILGYDNEGRVCHYLNPGRQNTEPSHRQVEHLVFMLERVIDLMPAQREKLVLLINFKTSKSRSNTAPGIGQGREVLHILQTHYPERLGRALIVNVPWVVWGFFKLITPFIDPLTREKLKFNEDMSQYVPAEHLWTEFSGTLEFDYDHATYWPALQMMCEERRAERERRWIAGGKHIGELEDYLTGHVAQGVAPANSAVAEAPAAVAAAAAASDAPEAAPATSASPAGDLVDEKKASEDQVEDLKVGELKVV